MWTPVMRAADGSTLIVVARTLMGITREEALERAVRAAAVLAQWKLTPTGEVVNTVDKTGPVAHATLTQDAWGRTWSLEILVLSGPMFDAAQAEAHEPTTPSLEGEDA